MFILAEKKECNTVKYAQQYRPGKQFGGKVKEKWGKLTTANSLEWKGSAKPF